jgi:hypothetical protein
MPSVNVPKELDTTRTQYGDNITYRYGQRNGECEFFCYRIVKYDPNGRGVELSWPQVKARCATLGIAHVPDMPHTGKREDDWLTGPLVYGHGSTDEC